MEELLPVGLGDLAGNRGVNQIEPAQALPIGEDEKGCSLARYVIEHPYLVRYQLPIEWPGIDIEWVSIFEQYAGTIRLPDLLERRIVAVVGVAKALVELSPRSI